MSQLKVRACMIDVGKNFVGVCVGGRGEGSGGVIDTRHYRREGWGLGKGVRVTGGVGWEGLLEGAWGFPAKVGALRVTGAEL